MSIHVCASGRGFTVMIVSYRAFALSLLPHPPCRIRLEHLKTLLTNFAAIASSEGFIKKEDLARYLNVPVSPVLEDMFSVYDRVRDIRLLYYVILL